MWHMDARSRSGAALFALAVSATVAGGCAGESKAEAETVTAVWTYTDNFEPDAEGAECTRGLAELPDVTLEDENGTLIATPDVVPGTLKMRQPETESYEGSGFFTFECPITLTFRDVPASKFYVFTTGTDEVRFSAQEMESSNWRVDIN